jgi:hypothetical protein
VPSHRALQGGNVADCPVDFAKQDGHHARAEHPGYDALQHPEWSKYDEARKLFLNWHPGPLGHEMIGNQVAYHHLRLMLRALDMLVGAAKRDEMTAGGKGAAAGGGGGLAHLEKLAAPRPLPHPAQCAPELCGYKGYRPACAYATFPKVGEGSELSGLGDRNVDDSAEWRSVISCPLGVA